MMEANLEVGIFRATRETEEYHHGALTSFETPMSQVASNFER